MAAASLIALYAPTMQSGKSEVAKTLQLHRGYKLVKFADPFKDMIRDLLLRAGATEPLIERMLEGDLKEVPIPQLGVSVRQMTQQLGTWGRSIHPDFWVNLAGKKIEDYLKAGVPVVIDDLRFPNEYERVLQLGGHPVKVYRPGTQPYTAHPSEGLLEHYPMPIIENNRTIHELRACAERLPELLEQSSPFA